MENLIHPSAVIDSTAVLGENVQVAPFVVIGPNVRIGANTKISSHAILEANSHIGTDCHIGVGAVIGGAPQDMGYKGEPTRVTVGNRSHIGEYVTLNRSSGEGTQTVVGEDCMLMAYSHLGHNCALGNGVILANCVQVGGHVQIDDFAFLGGIGAYHQNIRIGTLCMAAGMTGTRKDMAPFAKYDGRPATYRGMNSIGLKRKGISAQSRQNLSRAFALLTEPGLNQSQAVAEIRNTLQNDSYVDKLVDFIETSRRGVGFHVKSNWGLEEPDDVRSSTDPVLATPS